METKTYKLDSLCEITSSKRIFYSEYTESGIPFFRSKEIIDLFNKNKIATELFISKDRYNEIKSKFGVPEKDDMLLTSVGSIGIPYLVKSSDKFYFKDGNLTWFRNYNRKLIVPLYLYLWTTSSVGKETLMRLSMGAAQPALTISRLKNLNLNLPSVSVQQKIASILSAYDRLIENNTRRIRLLEQMAENLYKEWFVRFRFPGHENVEMVNGLPKGWERVVASSIIDVMSGGTPKTAHQEFYNGNIPFYTPKDANDSIFVYNTLTNITEEGLVHCNSRLYPRNTLIITARGTVGKLSLLALPMAMNQSCFALQLKKGNNPFFLYYAIRTEVAKLKKMANGGVFDTIVVKSFDHIKLMVPSHSLMDNFNLKVCPILEKVRSLSYQNQLLTRQCDLLLPRLMSGKLEVKS